jgi:hypothetical protein
MNIKILALVKIRCFLYPSLSISMCMSRCDVLYFTINGIDAMNIVTRPGNMCLKCIIYIAENLIITCILFCRHEMTCCCYNVCNQSSCVSEFVLLQCL